MASPVVRNFMKQQGFVEEPPDACDMHFQGLYFQPRIVFPLVLVGILLQSAFFFFALSAILWWNVLVPRLNPFEAAYNAWIAARRRTLPLAPAPDPVVPRAPGPAPRRASSRRCGSTAPASPHHDGPS